VAGQVTGLVAIKEILIANFNGGGAERAALSFNEL